jgi:hypothetical protein
MIERDMPDDYNPERRSGMGVQSEQEVKKGFVIKDSGNREQFASGMVRDTQAGKTLFSLILDGPMFKRWAAHLTKGAVKYAARNWMKAAGDEERERFKESALRHFLAWFWGEEDEDHAAGVFFNINGAEYVKDRMIAENAAEPRYGILPKEMIEQRVVGLVPDHELPQTEISHELVQVGKRQILLPTAEQALRRIQAMEQCDSR